MSERVDTSEERDKRAELMVRFLDLAENIEPFEGKKVQEVFSNETSRRELIENLDGSQFFELINGINGILRNKDKDEWEIDGGKVMLAGGWGDRHTPPRQEDKAGLLKKAFEEAGGDE